MHYQLETIHGVLGEKFMVEIINSFYRTFSYALLSSWGNMKINGMFSGPAFCSTREHTSRSKTAAKSMLSFYSTENEINFIKSSNNINDKLMG